MAEFILLIVFIILCFLGRFLLYLFSKKKKHKKKKNQNIPLEIKYLNKKFKISMDKIDKKSFMILISFIDSIIVSLTAVIVVKISNILILQLLLGLIMVLLLIYICYDIVGNILKKKGYDKDEL